MKKENFEENGLKILMIVILAFVGLCIIYVFANKYVNSSNKLYYVEYFDDYEPGSTYKISIYNDKIVFGRVYGCSLLNCEPKEDEEEDLKYSKENVNKFINFLKENFKEKEIKTSASKLNEYQNGVFKSLVIGEYFFELNIEKYEYKLEYQDSKENSYDVYFKDNGSIIVKKTFINEDYDITKIEDYELKFSKENKNIIREYVKSLLKEDEYIAYKSGVIRKDEEPLIQSIIKNDENILKNLEKLPKLSYVISYSGVNCQTPILYLYSDNTYEYYYTFTDGYKLTPKVGTFDYDITKITSYVEKGFDNSLGEYTFEDKLKNRTYKYSVTNENMNIFLSTLNINLQACLVQE